MDALAHIFAISAGEISIEERLDYSGMAPLAIFGNGDAVATEAEVKLFKEAIDPDFTLSALHYAGPSGFFIESRAIRMAERERVSSLMNANTKNGRVSLVLQDVIAASLANYRVHMSDSSLEDACCGVAGDGNDGSAP